MGSQNMLFAATLDIMAVRDQLRYLIGNLDRFSRPKQGFGRPKQGFGRPKQGFGRPKQGFGRPKQGFGRPKQGFGQAYNMLAFAKHNFGLGVDLVRILESIHARVDMLGSYVGIKPGELDLAAALQRTLRRCKLENMSPERVEELFKEQMKAVYVDRGTPDDRPSS